MHSKQVLLQKVMVNEVSLLAVPGYFSCCLPGNTILSIRHCIAYQERVKNTSGFTDSNSLLIPCPNECPFNYTGGK